MMPLKNLISWKVLAIALVLQIVPAYAQVDRDDVGEEILDDAGEEMDIPPIETYTPPTAKTKPEKKEKVGPAVKRKSRRNRKHAIFFERFPRSVRGTSSNQKVMFSATENSGKIVVSFILNGKEFRFVYGYTSLKEKAIENIQVTPDSTGQDIKTSADNTILASLRMELRRDINRLDPLENDLLSSLDLLVDMIQADLPFGKFESNKAEEQRGKTQSVKPKKYDDICAERGHTRTGTFDDDNGNVYKRNQIIGDPASECWGRCGTTCFQRGQIRKRQYTDQCFSHDLCADHFGGSFGNCTDEFEDARYGYEVSSNCAFYVVGKWALTHDWECNGTTGTKTITHYSDHRFMSSSGTGGTWTLNGNQIVRVYSSGTRYAGAISESNLKTEGTMTSPSGRRRGCFIEVYITTRTN